MTANANLYMRVAAHAARRPQHPAVRDERGTLTYGDLDRQAGAFAAWLADTGVAPGGHVALHLANSRELVLAYYGAVRAGAVPVPLHPGLAGADLAHVLAHADIRVLVTAGDHGQPPPLPPAAAVPLLRYRVWAGAGATPSGWLSWPAVLDSVSPPPDPVYATERQPAAIHYTSGTTGKPKGVVYSHFGLVRSAALKAELYGLGADGVVYSGPPLAHAAGTNSAMHPAITMAGGTLVLRRAWDTVEAARLLADERVTFAWMVPTMYLWLLDLPEFGRLDLSALRGLLYAAMPMPRPAVRRLRELLPHVTLFHSYGSTENGPMGTCLVGDDVEQRQGSVGRAYAPIRVRVVRDDGSPAAPGEVGEIDVSGPGVMIGYYKDPEATARTLRGEWQRTGDMGYLDADGFLYLVGRHTEVINRGGVKLAPAEIEEVLLSHPAVQEAAAVGVADPYLGQQVLAVVVLRPGRTAGAEEIRAHCSRHLSGHKVPAAVTFCESLPRNSLGKVQKHLLAPAAPH